MKMKKFLLVGLLGVVTLCGLSSCDDDDDGGYVPFSYAVGDMVVKDGSEPYIQLDSKQTLFPSNGSRLPNYLLKDGKRVIVNFSFLEGQREGYDYYILINDIDSVLVKNVIPITPETTDSIGNDPVNVLDMWTSDKYLTVQFEMRGLGREKHMINLVRNYSLSPNPDGDGYLQLELRHNRLNDPEIDHILWGVASFRLEDLKLENPDLKGLKIKVRSPYGTEVCTCDFEKEDSGEDAISGTQEKSVSTYVR